MPRRSPRVSIGLPVYNGELFLAQALDALLGQSFSDFELIISNNGSTDQTDAICRAYAARDKRIHYYAQCVNRGAAWNFNITFRLAQGAYFKWAAHDDLVAPEFLARCVAVLDRHPEVVLAHSRTRIIDEGGLVMRDYDDVCLRTESRRVDERFHDLLCIWHACHPVFGLIRASVLRTTPLIGSYAGSDRVLLAILSLYGPFCEVPEPLFLSRRHSRQSVACYRTRRAYMRWFDPRRSAVLALPYWHIFFNQLAALERAPLSAGERLRCYQALASWLRLYGRSLLGDLVKSGWDVLRTFRRSSVDSPSTKVSE